MTPEEFASFCQEAIKLAFKYPSRKDDIAYEIVGKGWNMGCFDRTTPNKLILEIWDRAGELELPDHHVYIEDGTSVKEKWLMLKDAVDELTESLNIKD